VREPENEIPYHVPAVIRLANTDGYAAGGRGAEIAYSIVDCAIGRLIVGATARGICFAGLGDSDENLEGELRGDYPRATIRRDDVKLRRWTDQIAQYLAGRLPMPDLPIDIRGTPFQLQVWNELRAIPAGETRSYSEIARRIARPTAVRAVGTANGANPVSILIPCHRALRASGHLGGYRWGLERKRKLLEMEARKFAFRGRS
jgi:AraC family transcriptional regulator of adaptative response/methylated-DNA-[protein]-cysteine methyltransferase